MASRTEEYEEDIEVIQNPSLENQTSPTDQNSGIVPSGSHRRRNVNTQEIDIKNIHSKREVEWAKEKERLLEQVECLKSEAIQREEKYKNLNSDHESLQDQKEELDDMYKSQLEETNKFEKKYNDLYEEYGSLTEKHERLGNESERKLGESNSSLEAEKDRSNKVCNDLKDVEEALEMSRSQLNEVREQKVDGEKKFENKIKELEEELRVRKESLSEVRVKLTKEEKAYKEVRDINNQLEEEQYKLRSKIKELQAIKEQKQKEIGKLAGIVEDFTGRLTKEQQRFHQEKGQHEDEIMKKTTALTKLESENKNLQEQSARYLNEIQRQTDAEMKLRNEIKECQKELNVLKNENKVIRERLDTVQEDNSALKSAKGRHDQEREEMVNVITSLKENIKDKEKALEKKKKGSSPKQRNEGNGPEGTEAARPTPTPRASNCQMNQSHFTPPPEPHTPVDIPVNQWYDSTDGQGILHEIYQTLQINFPNLALSRDMLTKNLTITVVRDGRPGIDIMFPPNFPNSAVIVKIDGRVTPVQFSTRDPSSSEFSTTVVTMLVNTILS